MLKELLVEGQGLLEQISFHESKPDRRNKINNSLKLLEFIRGSHTPAVQKTVSENPVLGLPKNIFPMFLLKNKSIST